MNGRVKITSGENSEQTQQPISAPLLEGPQTAALEVLWIMAIAALPWPLFLGSGRGLDPAPQPQWRIVLWLGSWILFVGYAFLLPFGTGVRPRPGDGIMNCLTGCRHGALHCSLQ